LPGIPRSSKSPWGEFVGTWDMEKAPLRTKTMKTTAMSTGMQNAEEVIEEKAPSPKQEVVPEKARTPTPQQEAIRTPSPKEVQERASSRPLSQDNQFKKSPSPAKVKTPDPPASPAKSPIQNDNSPKKRVVLSDPV